MKIYILSLTNHILSSKNHILSWQIIFCLDKIYNFIFCLTSYFVIDIYTAFFDCGGVCDKKHSMFNHDHFFVFLSLKA